MNKIKIDLIKEPQMITNMLDLTTAQHLLNHYKDFGMVEGDQVEITYPSRGGFILADSFNKNGPLINKEAHAFTYC
jgi:hypothetical protein